MTEAQLDAIETALHVTLPAEYRRVSAAFPFRPIGEGDGTDWFFDDPERVIAETMDPLSDCDYDRADWCDSYVVIGDSGAGDVYLLDAASAPALPVHSLSHESRRVEPEWPTFAAFVDCYLRAPEEYAGRREAERAAMRAWWRRAWLIMSVIGFFGIVVPLLFLLLAPRR